MRPLWRIVVITESPVSSGFLAPQPGTREITPIDHEVVELALLLPRWQAEALEDAAHRRGLTTGQMLRRMIGSSLKDRTVTGH
ncbi:MAG TPA: hypothetical protein VKD71_03935 [Gemmataceae bacterium]|nr:hypothetical protein [Gemmataceae bacterium]